MVTKWVGAMMALLLFTLAGTAKAGGQSPDLILHNGNVITGDRASPYAEALAVRDGLIMAVGSSADIVRLIGPETATYDIAGRTVIAGVNDAHDHVGDVPFGVQLRTSIRPMDDPPLSEIVAAVRQAAQASDDGAWLTISAGPAVMTSPAVTLAAIEPVAGNHPVIVTAWWGHGVILNAEGMRRLGLAGDDRESWMVERDPEGRLTGRFHEYAGWSILRTLHSGVGVPGAVAYLRDYETRRLSQGVTNVQIMSGYQDAEVFDAAMAEADLMLRTRIVAFPMLEGDPEARSRAAGRLVTVSGVKWLLDGTPIDQFAFSTTAYPGRPDWFGRPNLDETQVRALLSDALASGTPLMMHIVGDAMMADVLDQMEQLAPAEQWLPLRVRVEHANGLIDEQIARAARLGIVIAQPRPTSPIRAWIDAGIPVAYGSDSGFPPFVAFAQMVDPANPNSIDRETALAVLTRAPAFAEFAEHQRGIIKVGMQADLAVLSADIMTAPLRELAGTRSVMTIVAGVVAYVEPTAP